MTRRDIFCRTIGAALVACGIERKRPDDIVVPFSRVVRVVYYEPLDNSVTVDYCNIRVESVLDQLQLFMKYRGLKCTSSDFAGIGTVIGAKTQRVFSESGDYWDSCFIIRLNDDWDKTVESKSIFAYQFIS